MIIKLCFEHCSRHTIVVKRTTIIEFVIKKASSEDVELDFENCKKRDQKNQIFLQTYAKIMEGY